MSKGTCRSASTNVRLPRRSWMRGSSTTPQCARAPSWSARGNVASRGGSVGKGRSIALRLGNSAILPAPSGPSVHWPRRRCRRARWRRHRRSAATVAAPHLLHLPRLRLPRERFMAFLDKAASGLTKVFPRLRSDRDLAHYMREHVQPIAPDVPDETLNKPATMLNPPADRPARRSATRVARIASVRPPQGALPRASRRCSHQPIRHGLARRVQHVLQYARRGDLRGDDHGPQAADTDRGGLRIQHAHRAQGDLLRADANENRGVRPVSQDRRQALRPTSLHLAPVEKSDLANRNWQAGDLLFIDSSHICRTRGDLPYLFCNVIPSLPAGGSSSTFTTSFCRTTIRTFTTSGVIPSNTSSRACSLTRGATRSSWRRTGSRAPTPGR